MEDPQEQGLCEPLYPQWLRQRLTQGHTQKFLVEGNDQEMKLPRIPQLVSGGEVHQTHRTGSLGQAYHCYSTRGQHVVLLRGIAIEKGFHVFSRESHCPHVTVISIEPMSFKKVH